jgi:Pyruvate/2-oxoacid:ferredoxin oxidoreductase delta subunit
MLRLERRYYKSLEEQICHPWKDPAVVTLVSHLTFILFPLWCKEQVADCIECSTCHVYIPESAPLDEPSDAELDMLGYALGYREESSRLGCQVVVDEKLGDWCAQGGEFGLPRY